mgnify:CR=1 FL=1
MKHFSVKEASEILKISERAVRKRCVKNDVRRKSGSYYIPADLVQAWAISIHNSVSQKELENELKELEKELVPNEVPQTDVERNKTQSNYEAVLGKKKVPFKTTGKDVIHESKDVIHESRPEESDEEKLKRAIELITIAAAKQNVQHKIFTEEEYIDLIGTLDRVEHQQEQIQYLRNRIEKQDIALNNLFKSIEQRNFIEAKQKGYDKED